MRISAAELRMLRKLFTSKDLNSCALWDIASALRGPDFRDHALTAFNALGLSWKKVNQRKPLK